MPTERIDPFSSLKYKEFNIFLLMRFSIVMAWSMQFIVVEWLVYRMTKDPLSLGIIGLMEVVPAVSIALFAGHVVDQKEKRNLVALAVLCFTLLSGALFYVTRADVQPNLGTQNTLYTIYGLIFLGGLIRAFLAPSIFALMALLVPKRLYPNAATWSSTTWQLATVLGPMLAGIMIHLVGVHWSLCFVFAFSLCGLVLALCIPPKPLHNQNKKESLLESLKEGIRFVRDTKAILGSITLDMVAVLFGGAIALLPIYAQDILEVGSQGFGALRAAPALGATLTMIVSTRLPLYRKAGKKLLIAIFGFGICIIVFGISKSFVLSLVALFFYGVTDGVSMVIRQTILQLKTPDHMRGRVASVNSIFTGSSNELGALESGVTAKIMGTVPAVVFGGCMTLGVVVATYFSSRQFRELDLRKDVEENHET